MGTLSTTTQVENPEANREKLHAIIQGSRSVVLLSHGEAGKIEGRPMELVRADDDSTIYLVTGIDTKKVAEVERDPRVTIAIQNAEGTAMVSGLIRVSQDRALIDELWEDSWKAWFAEGKQDPTIAILVVTPNEGTYWERGVSHGLSYLWRYVKARVSGTEIETTSSDQQKVDFRH